MSPLLAAWIYEYTQRALDARQEVRRRGLYKCVDRLGILAGGLTPAMAVQVAAERFSLKVTR